MSTPPTPDPGTITAVAWHPTLGAAVRQAATVVVLKRAAGGMQVLLMRSLMRKCFEK